MTVIGFDTGGTLEPETMSAAEQRVAQIINGSTSSEPVKAPRKRRADAGVPRAPKPAAAPPAQPGTITAE
jgi:hypothetical protein